MIKIFDKFLQSNWDRVALLGIAVWLCIVLIAMIIVGQITYKIFKK